MIFATGVVVFALAFVLYLWLASPSAFYKNKWNHIATAVMLIGLGMMVGSLLTAAVRILP